MMSGYKNTEVGLIPEDWDVEQLGEVGEAIIGLTYKPSDVREEGTLVLRSSNIQNDALDVEDTVFVDTDIPERIMVRPRDVLICVRNGSRDLIGKSILLDERVKGMTFGAFMAVFRSSLGELVSFLFQSAILKRQIDQHLGATINQITNKSLNSFQVPVPRVEAERRAIVHALVDADGLLRTLATLIAKKRAAKQAAIQRLLTGHTRLPGFNGAWETKRLGEIGTFSKGRGIKRTDLVDEGLPCIRYGELYTRYRNYLTDPVSRISPEVAETALPIRHGDILFAGSGETAEEIGICVSYLGEDRAFAGGDIVVLSPSGQDPMYLGHLLNHPTIAAQKARLGQGDAVVHISATSLAQVEIVLPPPEEQTAIATVLSDMDAEIAALEARRDKTRAIKQGMMQQLLTGRIRLVESAGDEPGGES